MRDIFDELLDRRCMSSVDGLRASPEFGDDEVRVVPGSQLDLGCFAPVALRLSPSAGQLGVGTRELDFQGSEPVLDLSEIEDEVVVVIHKDCTRSGTANLVEEPVWWCAWRSRCFVHRTDGTLSP